jgi:serpin B
MVVSAVITGGCGGDSAGTAPGAGGTNSSPSPSPSPPTSGTPPTSTSLPPAVAHAQAIGSTVDPAIVAADNAFGLNLLNNLIAANGGNVAISPISVAMVLQIIYNGAGGGTASAMAQTLELGGLSTADLNADNAALQASLIDPDPQVQIILANSLWMHLADNTVLPSFTTTDEQYYGATIGDLSGAPDDVNAWVAGETQGLITSILPPESPDYYQQIVALVVNAIYFKGQWSAAFDPNQTAAAPFTLSDGTQVSVPMMHQTGSYGYLAGDGFQVLRLPYGQGRFSMLLVLPDGTGALNGFVAGVTAAQVSAWVDQLQTTYGSIAVPRFTETFGASLNDPLHALGMGPAYCDNPAGVDLEGIAPKACLADVEHKVVVEVDESGTVAAGATSGGVGVTVVQAPQFSMTLDHPFFYAIRDDRTGELLFIGTLQNPG